MVSLKRARMTWQATGMALLLYGMALLVWQGTFPFHDGLASYAVTDSLVRYGRLDVDQIHWMGLHQNTPGPDGLLYARKGFGVTGAALPLAALGLVVPGVGPVHMALLLNPLLFALAGFLLFVALAKAFPALTTRQRALVVLAWGLGSPMWAYTKTFFSEPLVALSVVGLLERLITFEQATDDAVRRRAAFGLGAWLGVGMLARTAHAVVVPLAVAAVLWLSARRVARADVWRTWLRLLTWLGVPLAAAGCAVLWYNWARYGSPFTTGYLDYETFSAVWWRGIVGQLVAPGRGLVWYIPWVVVVPWGIRDAWRRLPVSTLFALGAFVVYVLLYGKWYMWHGGSAWGPRFLVPMLPLLAWLWAPVVRLRPRVSGALLALAVGVNTIGVAWNPGMYDAYLEREKGLDAWFDTPVFFDPQYAQIPNLLRIGTFETLFVVWMQDGRLLWGLLAPLLGLVGVCVVSGVWLLRRGGRGFNKRMLAGITALVVLGTGGFLVQARRLVSPAYVAAAERLQTTPAGETMIWHNDPDHVEYFLNAYKGRARIHGTFVFDAELRFGVERLLALAQEPLGVWIVGTGPKARETNALDRLASRTRGLVKDDTRGWVEEAFFDSLRVAYYFDTDEWQMNPVGVALGVDGTPLIRLERADFTPTAQSGGIAAVRLVWQALADVPEDYQVFLHVLDANGQIVGQSDGPPQNGIAPTSGWRAGETYVDVHAVRLAPNLPPGRYALRVGMYRLDDLTRLSTPSGEDLFVIGEVVVDR
ncbi:hypothetical protein [Ardenticatena maritima]|nr:hypothetical protein [Ardenticatena maritima]